MTVIRSLACAPETCNQDASACAARSAAWRPAVHARRTTGSDARDSGARTADAGARARCARVATGSARAIVGRAWLTVARWVAASRAGRCARGHDVRVGRRVLRARVLLRIGRRVGWVGSGFRLEAYVDARVAHLNGELVGRGFGSTLDRRHHDGGIVRDERRLDDPFGIREGCASARGRSHHQDHHPHGFHAAIVHPDRAVRKSSPVQVGAK